MSTFKRKSGGVMTTVSAVKRSSAGSWTDVGFVQRRSAGAWTLVWPLFTVGISDQTVIASVTGGGVPQGARAGYRLNSSGAAEEQVGAGSYSTLETWLTSGDVSLLQARVTVTSGSLTSGTTGTWINLSTSPEWYLQDADAGPPSVTCIFTVEIRHAASGIVLDSATITLTSDYQP